MTDPTLFANDTPATTPGTTAASSASTPPAVRTASTAPAAPTSSIAPAAAGATAAPSAPAAPAARTASPAPAAPTSLTAPLAAGPTDVQADLGSAAGPGLNGSETGDPAGRVLASLDGLVGALRALAGARVEERLRLVGRCESRLAAVKSEAVTELARWRGEARAADVLCGDLKQSRGAAKREVKLAGQLADVPATSEALSEGAITPQHARMIAEAAEQAPAGTLIDEAELLAAAEREPADLFGRTLREHLNDLSGDDLEERRKRQRDRRELRWSQDPDGMYKLFGRFDPVTGARIETALTSTANKLRHAEDPKNRATAKQRFADALEMLVTRGGSSGGTAAAQGVDLLVIADYDTVAGRLRDARLADGTPLTPEELVRLACDANVLPALFNRKREPLWLGRGRRHASPRQRAVLAERDKGCIGCGASANWCQAHHIVHWEHGGTTDLDNLCLLCSYCHHHQVHTNGATIVRGPDGKFTLQPPDPRPPPPQRRPPPPDRRTARNRRKPGGAGPSPPNKRNGINHPIRC